MNEKQLNTLEIIKKHFNVEIKVSHSDGSFKTSEQLGYGKIFKNGNFKYKLNRYGFSNDGTFFQMSTWRK